MWGLNNILPTHPVCGCPGKGSSEAPAPRDTRLGACRQLVAELVLEGSLLAGGCPEAMGAQGCGRLGGKGSAGPGEGSGATKAQDGVCLTTVRRLREESAKKEELAVLQTNLGCGRRSIIWTITCKNGLKRGRRSFIWTVSRIKIRLTGLIYFSAASAGNRYS